MKYYEVMIKDRATRIPLVTLACIPARTRKQALQIVKDGLTRNDHKYIIRARRSGRNG